MSRTCPPALEALLSSAPWVQLLTGVARDRVIADCYDTLYKPGEFVARKGDLSTTWIGVADGLLKVSTVTGSGRSVMFTAVPSGSWVGEGSVIKREPRRYELLALRTTRVIHVPRATFMWLLETSIEFSRYVIDYLNERAGQFLAMHEVSRIADPAGRVAGAIVNLFNPVLYPKAGPLLNLSQEELGELVGLSRPTTNAALMKLKALRLVHPQYKGLLVLDVDRLRTFAYSVGA
jgi:CRP/FNR family cyclic AMP-dependent transcriptional regulator